MLKKSDCEYEESYVASDDENYILPANFGINTAEDSDIELEVITEQEKEYSSDESVEDESVSCKTYSIWIAKDETEIIHCQPNKPNKPNKPYQVTSCFKRVGLQQLVICLHQKNYSSP